MLTNTDALCAGLPSADDDFLEQVAGPWPQTEEFSCAADPRNLADFLKDLSGLARQAAA